MVSMTTDQDIDALAPEVVVKAIQQVYIEHARHTFPTYMAMAERMIETLEAAGYLIVRDAWLDD